LFVLFKTFFWCWIWILRMLDILWPEKRKQICLLFLNNEKELLYSKCKTYERWFSNLFHQYFKYCKSIIICGEPIFEDFVIHKNHKIWYPTKYKSSQFLFCARYKTSK
jgi:hypothetical protein